MTKPLNIEAMQNLRPFLLSLAVWLILAIALIDCGFVFSNLFNTDTIWFAGSTEIQQRLATALKFTTLLLAWEYFSGIVMPIIFAGLIGEGYYWPRYAYAAVSLANFGVLSATDQLYAVPILIFTIRIIIVVCMFLPASMKWPGDRQQKRLMPAHSKQVAAGLGFVALAILITTCCGLWITLDGINLPELKINPSVLHQARLNITATFLVNLLVALALCRFMWFGKIWAYNAIVPLMIFWIVLAGVFFDFPNPAQTFATVAMVSSLIFLAVPATRKWFKAATNV